ncbi:MAG TPA: hypothetical protein VF458_16425 [Ktedonobacteraceae bacterium]
MGCFRLGCAFFFSLIAMAVFTIVFAVFGSFLPLGHASQGIGLSSLQSVNLASPADVIQNLPPGALLGGGVGALIGLAVMIGAMKRASDVNWLKKHGTRITATVSEIQTKRESRSVPYSTANGTQYRTEWHTYYIVVAHWENPQTRQVHTFRSERRSFYPRKYATGSGISVLIDPQNLGRYFVEV